MASPPNHSPNHAVSLRGLGEAVNGQMLSAVACMCFFGFLRTGEVVVPSEMAYDAAVHLSVEWTAEPNQPTWKWS